VALLDVGEKGRKKGGVVAARGPFIGRGGWEVGDGARASVSRSGGDGVAHRGMQVSMSWARCQVGMQSCLNPRSVLWH
jgi:hypothetical protein